MPNYDNLVDTIQQNIKTNASTVTAYFQPWIQSTLTFN